MAFVTVLASIALWGSAEAAPVTGEAMVGSDPLKAFSLTAEAAHLDSLSVNVVESSGPGFSRAWLIEGRRDLSSAARTDLVARNVSAVKNGDIGFIHFYARTRTTTDETGMGRVYVAVRSRDSGRLSSFELGVSFGTDWMEFQLPFQFAQDAGPGEIEISLGLGFMAQTIEIGGLDVLDCGAAKPLGEYPRTRFSYPGREANAPWRQAALERIERIRKGAFLVRVTDSDGKPVPAAHIRVEQLTSAFQFGSALQFERLVHDSPDNLTYRAKALELFNEASPENDLKWPVWEGEWNGAYNRGDAVAALHWLRAHHFFIRGHNLVWPSWKNLPNSISMLRGTRRQDEIPKLVVDHIREIAEETRGLVDEWDVLNEPYTNHDLMDLFGRGVMNDWFRAASDSMPGIPLYLNDFSNHDILRDRAHVLDFESTAEFLLKSGSGLGGLGIQAHIGAEPDSPEQVLRVLDRYGAMNLPIRITEFDVWTDDEQLQADFTRDFLILSFSHPSVVGVQIWGFWEKAHWRPVAAMYRANWSEKANARVYKEWVLDRWRTRLDGVSDAGGRFSGRGFLGDYVVVAEAGGRRAERKFTVSKGGGEELVPVALP